MDKADNADGTVASMMSFDVQTANPVGPSQAPNAFVRRNATDGPIVILSKLCDVVQHLPAG